VAPDINIAYKATHSVIPACASQSFEIRDLIHCPLVNAAVQLAHTAVQLSGQTRTSSTGCALVTSQ
jgi:hypothetical protein